LKRVKIKKYYDRGLLGLAGSPAFAQHAEFQLAMFIILTSDFISSGQEHRLPLPSNSRGDFSLLADTAFVVGN